MSSFTEKLIELVKKYPIIYDLGNPEYKNVRKRDKIWDEIGVQLNEKGDEVKKKWKNLRDSYAKYLKSIKTTTGQSAKKNYKGWQWAPQMQAFKPFLTFAQTSTNVTSPVNISETEIQIANEIEEISNSSVNLETDNIVEERQTSEQININSCSETVTQVMSPLTEKLPPTPSTSKSKRQRSAAYNKEKKTTDSVDTVIEYLTNKKGKTQPTPTDMIFLGYSKTIETFSPRRQALTKLKIAEIMTQQECLHLEESIMYNQSSTSTSYVNTPQNSPLESIPLTNEYDSQSRPSTSHSSYTDISTNFRSPEGTITYSTTPNPNNFLENSISFPTDNNQSASSFFNSYVP